MQFSREMTGLAVIHAASGNELGKVREWLLDEQGEVVIALLTEGGGWLPQRRVFPFRDILRIGHDAVMVANEGQHANGDPPDLDGVATRRVLGKRMISPEGNELGMVDDILFEEETGRVTGWRLSSGIIDDILQGRPLLQEPLQLIIGEDTMIIRE